MFNAGLSQRANHPTDQLHLLHGSLFTVKCTAFDCDYSGDNFTDPIVPALSIPQSAPEPTPSTIDKTGEQASSSLYNALQQHSAEVDISDERTPLPTLSHKELPQCPKCQSALLRPGIVWFGEPLPRKTLQAVDDWVRANNKIDLILVIGTSARVYPAAGYVDIARSLGAKVAVVNMDPNDVPYGTGSLQRRENGWFFGGDAATIVPEMLKAVIGDI